jgi:hypothetical protein
MDEYYEPPSEVKIDSRLRCALFFRDSDLFKAKPITNPLKDRSVVYDRPNPEEWERLKREEIRRLLENREYIVVQEREFGGKDG